MKKEYLTSKKLKMELDGELYQVSAVVNENTGWASIPVTPMKGVQMKSTGFYRGDYFIPDSEVEKDRIRRAYRRSSTRPVKLNKNAATPKELKVPGFTTEGVSRIISEAVKRNMDQFDLYALLVKQGT